MQAERRKNFSNEYVQEKKTLTYSLTSVMINPENYWKRIFIKMNKKSFRKKIITFCEADNLLNEGVATPLCNSVRVVNSSHLINHCIAFNSASNFARLKS